MNQHRKTRAARRSWLRLTVRSSAVMLIACAMAAALVPSASAAGVSAGQLYAFGQNYFGQLGNATNNTTNNANATPSLVSLPGASGSVVQVAAGASHTLVLTSAGQLYAFGYNQFGQLGNSTNNGNSNPNPAPTQVTLPAGSGPITEIAAGNYHSLVLTATGQLFAFGYNYYGQLGNSTNNSNGGPNNANPTPTLVNLPGATVTQIAAGENFSLALTSTGQVYAFGNNEFGQLGYSNGNTGTSNPNPTPTLVPLPAPATEIAAGENHGLALTSTGVLYAWGDNAFGQLGSPANSAVNAPTPVALPGATGAVTQIAAGEAHSLALTSTGQVYAFGLNEWGQLGINTNSGTSNANPTPTLVPLPAGSGRVTRIVGAGLDSLVLTSSGDVFAFGDNEFGQLGNTTNNGTSTPNPTPTEVSFPAGATIDAIGQGSEAFASFAIVANLAVTTTSLPAGTVGTPYSAQLQAAGGTAPETWSASDLPSGLSLDPATGLISGTPTAAAGYDPTVTVTDGDAVQASVSLPVSIAAPTVPAPTPVPTPTPTPVPLSLTVNGISTSGPTAAITFTCSGTAGQQCVDSVTGTTIEHRRGGTVTAVTASAGRKAKGKVTTVTLTVAAGSVSLTAGQSKAVQVALNQAGARLLSKVSRVPVTLTFAGTLNGTRQVVFTVAPLRVRTLPDSWFHINLPCSNCYSVARNVPLGGIPKGAHATVTCHGGGCPFGRRSVTPQKGRINLATVLGSSRLQPGTTLTVVISAPWRKSETIVYTIQRGAVPVRTIQ